MRPGYLAGRYRSGGEGVDWVLANGARTVVLRPAPSRAIAARARRAFRNSTPSGAVNEAKIFVALHASDSGYDQITQMWIGAGVEAVRADPFSNSCGLSTGRYPTRFRH